MWIVCLTPLAPLTKSPRPIGRAMESCPSCSHLHQVGWVLLKPQPVTLHVFCRCLLFSTNSFYSNQWFTNLIYLVAVNNNSFLLPSSGIVSCMHVSFLTAWLYTQILQLFLPFHNTDFPGHSIGKALFPSLFISRTCELHLPWVWHDHACSSQTLWGSY